MVDNTILEAVQSFLLAKISPNIQLQVPNDDDVTEYKLMPPNVFIGWVPPPNHTEEAQFEVDGIKRALPAMVVGMDDGEDTGQDAGIDVRVTCITYNPGLYTPDGAFTPDFKGYRDLLNLLSLIRRKLAEGHLLEGGLASIGRPITWGMYPQQPIGYWVGWVRFRASFGTLPYLDSKLLD
jgi:hypothetical protein